MPKTSESCLLRLTAAALTSLLLAMPCTAVAATDLQGRVVAIADGDTLTLLDRDNVQHKLRIASIDAPEKAQAFGARAKQALSSLCSPITVRRRALSSTGGSTVLGGLASHNSPMDETS